ncbi:MAG: S-layer homology domain-containing protein, partial [Desulfotomaculaceae bacterium]|nr:S-layer homology domain-containing protein [Desulfotomaculaceae bacterium]
WFSETVSTAVYAGYINGYPDGTIKPNAQISRQEVATIAAKIKNLEKDPLAADSFTDSAAIPDWSKGIVGAVAQAGFMKGYPDGSFMPLNNMTRAEAVITLNNLLVKEEPAEDSDLSVIDKAGVYGPEEGQRVLGYDVYIRADGVTLQNVRTTGNLIIDEQVGEGTVTLNNVTANNLYIRGGGIDSIHINGGSYNKIIVEKTASGNVRIVAVNVSGATVVISENAAGENIILEGDFESVEINAPDVTITTQGDTTIGTITVGAELTGTRLDLATGTTVDSLVLNSETIVNNDKNTVKKVTGDKVAESTIANKPATSGGGGGGGGITVPQVTAAEITVDDTAYDVEITAGKNGTVNFAALDPAAVLSRGKINVSRDCTLTLTVPANKFISYELDISQELTAGWNTLDVFEYLGALYPDGGLTLAKIKDVFGSSELIFEGTLVDSSERTSNVSLEVKLP